MALIEKLNAVGDAVRRKAGGTELLTLDEMVEKIDGISAGPTDEELTWTGSLEGWDIKGSWDWFVEKYMNRLKFNNITNSSEMFRQSSIKDLSNLTINYQDKTGSNMDLMFYFSDVQELPKINYAIPSTLESFFYGAYYLKEIPDDFISNWGAITNSTPLCYMFNNAYSLRKIPITLMRYLKNNAYYTSSIYYSGWNNCVSLDEITNLSINQNSAFSSNAMAYTFTSCYRLKDIMFEVQADGTPYSSNWKNQTISLSLYTGWALTNKKSLILDYNSGITADKQVKDDETYQALKDDPDWFTCDDNYSRYNHDSAVRTINSLPDTSEYLATAGGTNTIKFKGAAGALTDGGAINTLTEEEIAVATAKGWTVSLV